MRGTDGAAGDGGVIVMDRNGAIAYGMNTPACIAAVGARAASRTPAFSAMKNSSSSLARRNERFPSGTKCGVARL
jgi:hypothetical protein